MNPHESWCAKNALDELACTCKRSNDVVNHPKHYTSKSIEVIEIIEAWDMGFHLGNVIKYVLRHADKNGLEDLKKARWYLDREIAKREKQ